MSNVEEQFLQWFKEVNPASAYMEGADECAGKFFIPSKQNLVNAQRKLEKILKQAQNETQRGVFKSYLITLKFNEPYMVPSVAAAAFFSHLLKEGIRPQHLTSLTQQVEEALDAYTKLLADQKWSTDIKILTCQTTDRLLGTLDTIIPETKDESLKKSLTTLKEKAGTYRKLYEVKGIKNGDFTEIYPILKKTREKIKHKAIYPQILADGWTYPETPKEIENKATTWLKKELPKLKKITNKLAKIYHVEPTVETVEQELNKRRAITKTQALPFVKNMRSVAQKVFQDNIVEATPRYDTRVIETPSYLVSMIPSGALAPFDGLTNRPFNVFFVTTDERFSGPSSVPDLTQLILHEEYGHGVNFSNSATRFKANPTLLEILPTTFSTHISDGIAFHREFEFIQMLKKLVRKKKPSKEEKEFLNVLKGDSNTETMLLENEFLMQEWRIMRFLRAIFDARINTEKQTIADFIEWAHKQTGLSKKMIYNQTWIFIENVGYAPCYSIAGDKIRKLQQQAIKNGISQIDFNTYISSLGFPPRKIFEQKIKEFIRKHTK